MFYVIPQHFSFRCKTKKEVIQYINTKYPLNLSDLEDFVERVYYRYPLISKPDIALIIKTTFETMRELLILGKVLNITRLFCGMRFYFFKYPYKRDIITSMRVKMSTPRRLRTIDYEIDEE